MNLQAVIRVELAEFEGMETVFLIMRMQKRPSRSAAGFTLIEILVVIAVVAVLGALLFAAFSRAREKGRTAACQSNLHQIGLAVQQYAQDHDGTYPGFAIPWWRAELMPYLKNEDVLHCPNRSSDLREVVERASVETDYQYNDKVFCALKRGAPGNGHGNQESAPALLYPSINWLFSDWDLTAPIYTLPNECRGEARYATMHSGGANYLFQDGHVKWLIPEDMGKIECEYRKSVKTTAPSTQ